MRKSERHILKVVEIYLQRKEEKSDQSGSIPEETQRKDSLRKLAVFLMLYYRIKTLCWNDVYLEA